MPLSDELSIEDAKHLLGLCAAGRLYEVENWIRSGRSLRVPRAVRRTPVEVAIELGFHSLVELLARHAPDQQSRNELLQHAVMRRRSDLSDLCVTRPFWRPACQHPVSLSLDRSARCLSRFVQDSPPPQNDLSRDGASRLGVSLANKLRLLRE